MNAALASLAIPMVVGLLLLIRPFRAAPALAAIASLASLCAAVMAAMTVAAEGSQDMYLGGWEAGLAIRFRLLPLTALLLAFTALIHLLVIFYAARIRYRRRGQDDFWPLSCLLQASLAALWLSADLFNLYVTLELLGLIAVAMVSLAGRKGWRPALDYLLLSLAGSLLYLLGIALLYGRYGALDVPLLAQMAVADQATRLALVSMTLGLMLKGALWPLHLWLPSAHANAPTPVSALLSAVVVKGPLFILWLLWGELAPLEMHEDAGRALALAGVLGLVFAGWKSFRSPWLKVLVAYSTVAQLGYALLALGLFLYLGMQELYIALWLFVLAHGLAKVAMFLAAGEMQDTLGSRRTDAVRGATQTMPLAMFAFAVAGGSLIGLPPSGGFVAKWALLRPIVQEPQWWPWLVAIFAGTLMSAAYVFRVVVSAFQHVSPARSGYRVDTVAQWLTLLPALLVWGMALISEPLIQWLTGVTT